MDAILRVDPHEYGDEIEQLLANPPTNRQEFYEWVQTWLDLEEKHHGEWRIAEKEVKEKLTSKQKQILDTYLEDIAYGKPIWTLLAESNDDLIRTDPDGNKVQTDYYATWKDEILESDPRGRFTAVIEDRLRNMQQKLDLRW